MTKNNPWSLIFKGIGSAIGYGLTVIAIPLVSLYLLEYYASDVITILDLDPYIKFWITCGIV